MSTYNQAPSRSPLPPWLPHFHSEAIHFKGQTFHRIVKPIRNFQYGEVVLDDLSVIPYYASIYRVYSLVRALKAHIGDRSFLVEEKLDGYNIRATCISGSVVAFTRGGYPCPYSTELIHQESKIVSFLEQNPAKVLTCEVIGENPYNNLSARMYGPKPKVVAFDLMTRRRAGSGIKSRSLLTAPTERRELLRLYHIPQVKDYGTYNFDSVPALVESLTSVDRATSEGFVIKPLIPPFQYIKFVNPEAHIAAVVDHVSKCFEGSTAHFRKRLHLIAAYLEEVGSDALVEEVGAQLGRGILRELVEMYRTKRKSERYTISITDSGWDYLHQQMTGSVRIEVVHKEPLPDGRIRVSFDKVYKKTTGFLQSATSGHLFVD